MNSSITEESDPKVFDFDTAKVFLIPDGIICIAIKDDVDILLADATEQHEAVRHFAGGKKRPVLIRTGDGGTMDKEGQAFYRSERVGEPALAEAIIARSLAHKLIINFLIKFDRPGRLIRMFTDEEEAVDWLNEERTKYNQEHSN